MYFSNIDDYVLKVAGRDSYIHGNYGLIDYSQIVKALSKHRDIQLALVKRLDTSIDLPQDIPDVSELCHVTCKRCHVTVCLFLSVESN